MSQYIKIPAPEDLPLIERAIDLFIEWRNKPLTVLGGLAPIDLFKGPFVELDRVWVVGSAAWLPIVMGQKHKMTMPGDQDIDLCFHTKEAAIAWANNALLELGERTKEKWTCDARNRFGGPKIFRGGRTSEVFDLMWLPPNRTLAEMLQAFPRAHEQCAISMAAASHDLSAVHRKVLPWKRDPTSKLHREECEGCACQYNDRPIPIGS